MSEFPLLTSSEDESDENDRWSSYNKRKRNNDSGGENGRKIKFTFGKKKKKAKMVNLFDDLRSEDSDIEEETKLIESLLEARTTDSPVKATSSYNNDYVSPVRNMIYEPTKKYTNDEDDNEYRPPGERFSSYSTFSSSYNTRPMFGRNTKLDESKTKPGDVDMLKVTGLYDTLACRSRRWLKARRLKEKQKENGGDNKVQNSKD